MSELNRAIARSLYGERPDIKEGTLVAGTPEEIRKRFSHVYSTNKNAEGAPDWEGIFLFFHVKKEQIKLLEMLKSEQDGLDITKEERNEIIRAMEEKLKEGQ